MKRVKFEAWRLFTWNTSNRKILRFLSTDMIKLFQSFCISLLWKFIVSIILDMTFIRSSATFTPPIPPRIHAQTPFITWRWATKWHETDRCLWFVDFTRVIILNCNLDNQAFTKLMMLCDKIVLMKRELTTETFPTLLQQNYLKGRSGVGLGQVWKVIVRT